MSFSVNFTIPFIAGTSVHRQKIIRVIKQLRKLLGGSRELGAKSRGAKSGGQRAVRRGTEDKGAAYRPPLLNKQNSTSYSFPRRSYLSLS